MSVSPRVTARYRAVMPLAGLLMACVFNMPGLAQDGPRRVAVDATPAAAGEALARPVTIRLDQVSLQAAIRAIGANAGVRVQYQAELLNGVGTAVTISANKLPLGDVLSRVLRGTQLQAVALGPDLVSIVPASSAMGIAQATGTITGRVTDSATARGIPGMTVTVQGANQSMVTKDDGRFAFRDVPAGTYTVMFRTLGYPATTRTAQVEAGQSVVLHVTLRQNTHMLSGVVTTATGTQKRLEVGNSIAVLNVDSILQVAPVTTLTDLLEGRVPGLTVQRTSGTPGDPSRIRIRGTSSINANNDPIIIVDGVRIYSQQSDERNINSGGGANALGNNARTYASPSAIDLMDLRSFERVEVLRGPSAAAMYGSEAANGVIVVTTKQGRAGPTRTDVSLNAGTSYRPGQWPTVTYHFGTSLLGGPPILCVSFCGDAGIDSVVRFQALNNSRLTALGRGSDYGGSVRISGGSGSTTYSFTATSSNRGGILKLPAIEEERYLRFQGEPAPDWMRRPDRFDRQGITGNVQVQLARQVTFSASTRLDNGIQRRTSMSTSEGSAIAQLQRAYVDLSQLTEKPLLGNPYERVVTDNSAMQNDVQLQVRQWAWLPLNLQVGKYALTENVEMSIKPRLTLDADSVGAVRGRTKTATNITTRVTTDIPAHRFLSIGVGMEFIQKRTADQSGSFRGFGDGVTNPATGLETTATTFSKETSENPSFGWFVAPRFNFGRCFASPGFRLDNNGLSGKNAGLNSLPKIDFSCLPIDPSRNTPLFGIVTSFRPRGSFGVAGVVPNAGDQLRLFTQKNADLLGSPGTAYGKILDLETLGNTRLKPERGTEFEGGFDADVGGRLNLSITAYRKFRKDAIVENNFASSVYGGGKTKMNVGDIRNTGVEVDLGMFLVESPTVSLSIATNFARGRSKVVRLSADGAALQFGDVLGGVRYVVGYPVEGIWERQILGYEDVDGNGWIRSDEIVVGTNAVYVGSTEPKHTAGISPSLRLFRGLVSLTTQFTYTGGLLQSLDTDLNSQFWLRSGGLSPIYGNLVQGPDGFDRQVAVLGLQSAVVSGRTNAGVRQEVNVLRLQSFSARFNLGTRGARLLRARTAALSVQGANLGLWTNYVGADPNVNGILGGRGLLDTGGLPQSRSWSVQLNLGY